MTRARRRSEDASASAVADRRCRGDPVGGSRAPRRAPLAWRRTLEELERRAVEHGDRVVQLETNALLVEAIALYRSAGFVEVAAFNDEPFADHWFRKDLQVAAGPE